MPVGALQEAEVYIRRGQFTIVCAAPGVGKSALVQYIVHHGDGQGGRNRTLYLSADSDEHTMWLRGAAMASGYDMGSIEKMAADDNIAGVEAQVGRDTSHIEFSYHTSPTDSDFKREIDAYATKYGAYPEVIVMDNIKNLYAGEGGEFEALEGNCVFLQTVARETGAAVIGLHHATGEYESGDRPIPQGGLRGKLAKTPEVILTLHRTGERMFISPVKNRNGRANAQGGWNLPVLVDLSRMSFN